ncbi:hypothetical protein [Prosthecobacter sp.]|uniref:hypothetical protein n=1 Tax=Prosthecobacter sp. TaxID=1965333 RepID=UPI003785108A
MRSLSSLIAMIAFVACAKEPEKTAAQLKSEIHAAAEAAEQSVKDCDKAAAEAAASSAAAAMDQLRKLKVPADAALVAECEAEARNAGLRAELVIEKVARNERLAGWRAKTYYAVESATFTVFFHGLSLAADQAAAGRLELLPQSVQDGAKRAAEFIESYVGPQRLASGELNWKNVSVELKKFAESPPVDLRVLMVLLMSLGMDFNSAFYEIEAIPEGAIKTAELQATYHVLRGVAYLGQGYGQLAFTEFEVADRLSSSPEVQLDPMKKCGVHLLLACYFLKEQRWSDADRCLASASRAWPDNPVVIYLTGEREIAGKDYAAADESFAKALKGTDYEWLAEKIAARVKRLRDNPASLEPFLLDHRMMADLAWSFIKNQSEKSDALKKLQKQVDATQSFLQELKKKIPDVELKMPELKGLFKKSAEAPTDKP